MSDHEYRLDSKSHLTNMTMKKYRYLQGRLALCTERPSWDLFQEWNDYYDEVLNKRE